MTSPLDLDAISSKWLQICGSCDAGIGECTHPAEDYRPVMLELVREVEALRRFGTEEADLDRIYAERLRAAAPLEQRAAMALLAEQLIAEVKRLRAELDRYHHLHDYLDEAAREAEPVMLASAVVEISPLFPVAWPAVHAGLIQRALAKVNGTTIERPAGA
jgi:hypothetical protein